MPPTVTLLTQSPKLLVRVNIDPPHSSLKCFIFVRVILRGWTNLPELLEALCCDCEALFVGIFHLRDLSHLPNSVDSQQLMEASHKINVVLCLVTDAPTPTWIGLHSSNSHDLDLNID